MALTMAKKMKKGLNYLSTAYYSGSIAYSRVDNSFIRKDSRMDMYPHPRMTQLNRKFEPLETKKPFIVKKENLPVFLSALKIMSPALIEETFLYVDYFLDDKLKPRKDKIKEIEKIIEDIDSFSKKEKMRDLDMVKLRIDFFQESRRVSETLKVYSIDSLGIKHEDEERTQKARAIVKQKNKQYDTLSSTGCITSVECLKDAIDDFRRINKINKDRNLEKRSKWQ